MSDMNLNNLHRHQTTTFGKLQSSTPKRHLSIKSSAHHVCLTFWVVDWLAVGLGLVGLFSVVAIPPCARFPQRAGRK
jgi:hypothetical protein